MARTKNRARRGNPGAKHTANPHVKAPHDGGGRPLKKKRKGGDQTGQGQGQGKGKGQKKGQQQQQQRKPVIPFQKGDRVLLVGEGDFSFSCSLAAHHGIHGILATCYDSESTLNQKYPQAKKHIEQINAAEPTSKSKLKRKRDDNEEAENANPSSGTEDDHDHDDDEDTETEPPYPKVLYSIDARKLGSPGGGGKLLRKGLPRVLPSSTTSKPWEKKPAPKPSGTAAEAAPDGGPWDVIAFNFPHVGGLSTDVNRQVRANQELLVKFFKACVSLLSVPLGREDMGGFSDGEDEEGFYGSDDDDDDGGESRKEKIKPRTEPGQIVVTLFEGEPYTLWNIKDLARHAGLRVVTSFRFPWGNYPGYSHARTLGEIEGKGGGRGGWRGEDREARSYVFERKDHESLGQKPGGKRKRGNNDDSDDDE